MAGIETEPPILDRYVVGGMLAQQDDIRAAMLIENLDGVGPIFLREQVFFSLRSHQ